MSYFFGWAIVLVSVVISIPFYTLLERKVLSYSQTRKGPNKVSVGGVLQPVSDGVKLLLKEQSEPSTSSSLLFWLSPLLSFLVMVGSWSVITPENQNFSLDLGVLVILCVISLNVFTVLGAGWGSNSKYCLLGGVRGASQTVSYEIGFISCLFIPTLLGGSYNLFFLNNSFLLLNLFPLVGWLILILMETNRAPFDFSEGESELVSGFNTEYSGLGFTLLFLGEYGMIILMSALSSLLFLGGFFKLPPS